MSLIRIALIVVVKDPMQFIGWVVLYCVCAYAILDGIITKLLFAFRMKKGHEQGTYLCDNLYFKLEMAFIIDLLVGFFYEDLEV